MTEDTAWIIEEYPTEKAQSSRNHPNEEWHTYPSITDRHNVDDMLPATLEECLTYLRDDPFHEHSKNDNDMWILRIRNVITGEIIPYCAL